MTEFTFVSELLQKKLKGNLNIVPSCKPCNKTALDIQPLSAIKQDKHRAESTDALTHGKKTV